MRRAVPRLGGGAVATGAAAGHGGVQGAVEAMTGRLVSIVVRRDFPLCGRFFIVGVSLLFLFFGKQPHDALPFGVIRSPLKQLAVMFYVLAPDESDQGPCLHWARWAPEDLKALVAADQSSPLVPSLKGPMWKTVRSLTEIPKNRDLRLGVLDGGTVHALEFPCRLREQFWVNAKTDRQVEVFPTHWQEWSSN